MLYMNNMIKLSCLASTCVVLVQVANSASTVKKEGVFINNQEDFNHYMTLKSWENRAIELVEDIGNSKSFISDRKYRKSIVEVISKAIADCVHKRNEFGKFWKNVEYKIGEYRRKNQTANKDEIQSEERRLGLELCVCVTFDVSPKQINYTRANWNAFILYNYLNLKINTDKGQEASSTIIDDVVHRKCNSYLLTLELSSQDDQRTRNLVNLALGDIKKYVKALNLDDYITELKKSRLTRGQFMPPKVIIPKGGEYTELKKKVNGSIRNTNRGKFIVTRTDYRTHMLSPEIYTILYNICNGSVTSQKISGNEYWKYVEDLSKEEDDDDEIQNNNINNQNNNINNSEITPLEMPISSNNKVKKL